MSLPTQLNIPNHSWFHFLPKIGLDKLLAKSHTFNCLWQRATISPNFRPWTTCIVELQEGSLYCPKVPLTLIDKFAQLSKEIESDVFRRDGFYLLFFFRELSLFYPELPSDTCLTICAREIDGLYWDTSMCKRLLEIYKDSLRPLEDKDREKYSFAEKEMIALLHYLFSVRVEEMNQDVALHLLASIGR